MPLARSSTISDTKDIVDEEAMDKEKKEYEINPKRVNNVLITDNCKS